MGGHVGGLPQYLYILACFLFLPFVLSIRSGGGRFHSNFVVLGMLSVFCFAGAEAVLVKSPSYLGSMILLLLFDSFLVGYQETELSAYR